MLTERRHDEGIMLFHLVRALEVVVVAELEEKWETTVRTGLTVRPI